jgi:iron complex transport system substrate-binding protein
MLAAAAYPVTYTNCGVENTVNKAPERVITMTQGAPEFMLALGLENHMVGTAYLDDSIWPKYATAYAKIPVLSSSYPTEAQITSKKADFLIASFNSAFRQVYTDKGKQKGIFSTATIAPCNGTGGEELGVNEAASNKLTCRKELNKYGIGTFLFQDACEDKKLRPTVVSETVVYEELRSLGKIFDVDGEHIVKEMEKDFKAARALISANMGNTPLNAVWLDCVGCCKVAAGEDKQVYVGAGNGVPQMLMQEAGLTNLFKSESGNWACVKEKDVIAAKPDVIVVVDAAWDSGLGKLQWLYNQSAMCGMEVIKAAQLIQIPFSATSLGPRNGPAAFDLASAALHVRLGNTMAAGTSGVGSFNLGYLQTKTAGLKCNMEMASVKYDTTTTTTANVETSGHPEIKSALWLCGFWWVLSLHSSS